MSSTIIHPVSAPTASQFLPEKLRNFLSVFFFAALFFLCSADLFLAVRIRDFNFRFGQILILIVAVAVITRLLRTPRKDWFEIEPHLRILKNWGPFLLAYALAVALSQDLPHGFLKLGWAVFNIGGAALVCLNNRRWNPLKKGLFLGIAAIALVIWVQFIAIYLLGAFTTVSQTPAGWSFIQLSGIFIGYAQDAGHLGSVIIFRPHAFFYEPSYAGCALTLAFPLCLSIGLEEKNSFIRSILIPALVLGAAWMTSSRSAILGTSLSMLMIFLGGAFLKKKKLLKNASKILFIALLLLGFLALSSKARDYFGFFTGISEPSKLALRVEDPNSSEGWRWANVLNSLRLWKDHPLFGMGVPPLSGDKRIHGLGQTSESMWLEVGVESGLLGFLTFAFGILKTMTDAIRGSTCEVTVLLVAAALAAHLIISMNLTSTFPRLDYWLLFFFAARLCLESREGPATA